MIQLKHENHFVPQMYLKNWGDNKNRIWSYRLLVPNKDFPNWKHQPIGGVAFLRDLYTVISNGKEDDDFERWIESEFETPAQDSITKVIQNKKLTPTDWVRLINFLAAQDVRTPTNYIESIERWSKELPNVMKKVLEDTVHHLDEHFREGKPLPEPHSNPQFFSDLFNVTITPNTIPEKRMGEIRAEVVTGRKFWIESQRYLLTNTVKVLYKHKWSIVEPSGGMSWFTSDHPVLRLNYTDNHRYDFKGGWGRNGGNLLMPLSPYHLLFTQIGSDSPDHITFSVEKTYEIQKFLAERAYKWIFAHKRLPGIIKLRPRHVDLAEFNREEEQWRNWHQLQSSVETK